MIFRRQSILPVSSRGAAFSGVNFARNTATETRYQLDKKNFRVPGTAYVKSAARGPFIEFTE